MSYLYSTFHFRGRGGFCRDTNRLLYSIVQIITGFQHPSIDYSTEFTEWQWPLSGVYSIMVEKSAQPGAGAGCTLTPFHYIYPHVQVLYSGVRCSWEGIYTHCIVFHLYPYMYSVDYSQRHSVSAWCVACLFCVVKHSLYKPSHPTTHWDCELLDYD